MIKLNKNLAIVALTLIVAIVTLGFSTTQESSSSILTVRTTETTLRQAESSMITVYPDGRVNVKNLEKSTWSDLNSNLKTVNQHLNSLVAEGYKIAAVACGKQNGLIVTTYTLTK